MIKLFTNMAKELRVLCQGGGFDLTKKYTNNKLI